MAVRDDSISQGRKVELSPEAWQKNLSPVRPKKLAGLGHLAAERANEWCLRMKWRVGLGINLITAHKILERVEKIEPSQERARLSSAIEPHPHLTCHKTQQLQNLVRWGRLELPILSALASKTSVYIQFHHQRKTFLQLPQYSWSG